MTLSPHAQFVALHDTDVPLMLPNAWDAASARLWQEAGATAIATKRSGLFGRAPVLFDVQVGLIVWGFLDDTVDSGLAGIRPGWFDEVHLRHNYSDLRRIADSAPEDVLRLPHGEIEERHRADWRSCLDLDV